MDGQVQTKDVTNVLKKLEYGVYVVTVGDGTAGNAFTASWVTQVSSEPPMVAIAVHNAHQSNRQIAERGSFAINVLGEGHAEIARMYYGPAESGYQKLKDRDVEQTPATRSPLLKGVAGFIDCQVTRQIACGNHTLFIADVRAAELMSNLPILTTTNSRLRYTG